MAPSLVLREGEALEFRASNLASAAASFERSQPRPILRFVPRR
jgi:hypothetical protein